MKYVTIAHAFGTYQVNQTAVDALVKLNIDVNKAMSQGWRPVGGICIAMDPHIGISVQAMERAS